MYIHSLSWFSRHVENQDREWMIYRHRVPLKFPAHDVSPYDMMLWMTLTRRMVWGTPWVWHLRTGRAVTRSGTRSSPYPVCLTYIFRFPNQTQFCQPGNMTECNRTPNLKTEYTKSRHNHTDHHWKKLSSRADVCVCSCGRICFVVLLLDCSIFLQNRTAKC